MVVDLTTATFTGSEEGDIVLSYSNSSACAIYISSIEIVTDGKIESKPEEVKTAANIAEFKSFSTGTKAVLTLKNAKVQYVNGTSDYYIADETGGIDIFKPTGLTYTAGQVLNGTITATYDEYCKLPELTKIEENNLTATDGTIEPIEMTIAEAAKSKMLANLSRLLMSRLLKMEVSSIQMQKRPCSSLTNLALAIQLTQKMQMITLV